MIDRNLAHHPVLAAFVLLLNFSCGSNLQKSNGDAANNALPPDSIGDLSRNPGYFLDQSSDVARGDGQFNFKSLLETKISVKINAFDLTDLPQDKVAQMSAADVLARGKTPAKDAILILRDAKSKSLLFAGKADINGAINGSCHVPAHTKTALLELVRSGYHQRSVTIENLATVAVIDRQMGIIGTQTSATMNTMADADSDGVPDIYDAFPQDAKRAFSFATPADGWLTVAFEDNYPNLGDGDYNDFIATYKTTQVMNAANQVVEITTDAKAVAKLASYDHRFGIVVNFPGAQAVRTTKTMDSVGNNLNVTTATLNDRSDATFFNHSAQSFSGGKGYLTSVRLVFNTAQDASKIDASPFDPYIYIYNTRYDVHLIGKPPLPGSKNPPTATGFRDANGFPRALLVSTNWFYPKESVFMESAYPNFKDWRLSGGQNKSDWYFFPVESKVVRAENDFSDRPSVSVPSGYDSNAVQIAVAGITPPPVIGNHFKPVGKVYDITMTNGQNNFGAQTAQIRFKYDLAAVAAAGLLEEFAVFYYDDASKTWKNSYGTRVDYINKEVIADVNHFTPYVLTALPATGGGVANPPSCIAQDFPLGSITTTSGPLFTPKFTVLADNFRYYQDRPYAIVAKSSSPENAATFSALGLDFALGISTCNGMPGGTFDCGPVADNKTKSTAQYIQFTAHKDLDIYVMYDIRGGGPAGATNTNTSSDAPWLASAGFTDIIGGQRYFIQTTDSVGYYRVYKKSYLQGQQVILDGNRMGVSNPAINTNYWVAVKPLGDTSPSGASSMCVAQADTSSPGQVTSVQAIPGATSVTLTWQNPNDPDFAGVVIRRSQPPQSAPLTVADGVAPSPSSVISPQAFRDSSVSAGNSYWYTIFSLDANNNYIPGPAVFVTTAPDTDGDGLSDAYENATVYATGQKSSPLLVDTDGDGIGDSAEVIARTDPTNPDVVKPTIMTFSVAGANPNTSTIVPLNFIASDNTAVTHYMVTLSPVAPYSDDAGWQPIAPISTTVPGTAGTYTIYAWARDAAGNVSNPFTASVTIINAPTPTVTSVAPADGSLSVGLMTAFSVTFSEAMNPATLDAIVAASNCTGSIQVSDDNFNTCVPMSAAIPSMSAGDTIATLSPAGSLHINSIYKIRVTVAAKSNYGVSLGSVFTSSGFTTISDATPPSTPADFAASTTGSNMIYLSWAPANDNITNASDIVYEICRASVPNGCTTFAPAYTTAPGVTAYDITTGLVADVKYYFKLRARDMAGNTSMPSPDSSARATATPTWAYQAYLKASNAESGDFFGNAHAVAISGDTIVVGAYREASNQTTITNGQTASGDNSLNWAGAAYIFKRTGSTWVQEAYLKAPDPGLADFFGFSVAISGDLIVVGAHQEDSSQTTITNGMTASSDNSATDSGAAYIFRRIGATWVQEAYLKASNAGASDEFGFSVAASGDTVVIGARSEASNQTTITNGPTASADNSAIFAGAAYVFKNSGITWFQEAYLKAPNADIGDSFGTAVAISGDTIVVGAPSEDSSQTTITNGPNTGTDKNRPESGAAYIFRRKATNWTQEAYLKASNADAGDYFGFSVAISGDVVSVGSSHESSSQTTVSNGNTASTDNGAANAGATYVFRRTGTNWAQEAYLKAPNANALDLFGNAVGISGNTVVVGAHLERSNQNTVTNGTSASADNSQAEAGAAYIFRRTSGSWSPEAYLKAPNNRSFQRPIQFGSSVHIFGDTVIIGAPWEASNQTTISNGTLPDNTNGANGSGAVYIFTRQ